MLYRTYVVLTLVLLLVCLLLPSAAAAQEFDCAAVTEIPQEECEALVALYDSTNGSNWKTSAGWLQIDEPCQWYGISCMGGRNVHRIDLSDNHLVGPIPSSIGDLGFMTYINLGQNQIHGPIPDRIGDLLQLRYLYLYRNRITGNIPVQIGKLHRLIQINIADNMIDGDIPEELYHMGNLRDLTLSDNYITGSISHAIENMHNIESIYLFSNNIEGSIPVGIGQLNKLSTLVIADNKITGNIPCEIVEISSLRTLAVSHNPMVGKLPDCIYEMKLLQGLYIGSTNLSVDLAKVFIDLKNIQILDMSNTGYLGEIPKSIDSMVNARIIDVSDNKLYGRVPSSIGKLKSLESLYIYGNRLSGSLPDSMIYLNNMEELFFDEDKICTPNTEEFADWFANIKRRSEGIPCEQSLPVELVEATGMADGNGAVLAWQTATERNNAGFEVQHLTAPADAEVDAWHTLVFVAGHGTTDTPQHYEHRVGGLTPGTHRFRLKQLDHDGAATYSPEVEVIVGIEGPVAFAAAYPNPFNPRTQAMLSVARTQHVRAEAYDALGRLVAVLYDGPLAAGRTEHLVFEGAGLASGVYVLHVRGEHFSASQRVTLVK